MSIRDIYVRDVVTVPRTATINEAARLMRERHVGDVVVVDTEPGRTVPVGVVTDRDIVVEVLATGLDPAMLKVGDLLQRPLFTVGEETSSADVIRLMAVHGVRRMPVVRRDGGLVGIVCIDDLMRHLAVPLAALAELPVRERQVEMRTRP